MSRHRRATLVASTNNPSFLVDTHNRRYLAFTTKEIDYLTKVDMDQVYAQAYQLLREGEPYWLNAAEQSELNRMNARYRMPTIEEELDTSALFTRRQ
ncbi:MAG: VapE family protein [Owenweeksia sp.]|nr:VapE family protein [Owenweeksia sp.]